MTQHLCVSDALKFAQLKLAAEAFIQRGTTFRSSGSRLEEAQTDGNGLISKFTSAQAKSFAAEWEALGQRENTTPGFSGTLFRNRNNPNELVISLRSTEFPIDAARDNLATDKMEIAKLCFAFGPLRILEDGYQSRRSVPSRMPAGPTIDATGHDLGGHLATASTDCTDRRLTAANGVLEMRA